MGGGTTNKPELAKSTVDLLAQIPKTDEFAGMAGEGATFCQKPPNVPFHITGGAQIQVGMAARVVSDADPMPVMNGAAQIGVVDDAFAVALRGCLAMGYKFTGKVVQLDRDAETGTLAIRGQPQELGG